MAGLLEQAKSLAQRIRKKTQETALAQAMRKPVQVSSPIGRAAYNLATATPGKIASYGFNQSRQALNTPLSVPRPVAQTASYFAKANPQNVVKQGLINNKPLQSFSQWGLKYGTPKPGGVARVKEQFQKNPNQFNILYTKSGIKPLDYTTDRIRNYVLNNYVASAKDLPKAVKGIVKPEPMNIMGYDLTPNQTRVANVGRTVFDIFGAVPDPTDAMFATYNFLKGARSNALKTGKDLSLENIKAGVKSATLEDYAGLGDALTTNPTGQMVGNLLELPAIIALGRAQAVKGKRTAAILRNEPSVTSLMYRWKNLESLPLTQQIEESSKLYKLTDSLLDEMSPAVRKAINKIKAKDPELWARQALSAMQDMVATAKDPVLNIGFQARPLKKLGVQDTKIKIGVEDTRPPTLSIDYSKLEKKLDSILQTKKFGSRSNAKTALQRASAMGDETATKYLEQASKLEKQLSKTPKLSVEPVGGKVGGEVSTTSKPQATQTEISPEGIPKTEQVVPSPDQSVSVPRQTNTGIAPKPQSQPIKPTDNSQPYFNTERLAISPEGKKQVVAAIEQAKPEIEKVVGKKLTNKEVIETSKRTSKILDKAVGRDQTEQWNAALLNARRRLAKLSESGKIDQEYLDTLVTIKSLGSDIARKLQSFGIDAEAGEITSKQAILDAVLKVNKNTEEILKAAEGVDFNNLEQATSFYRKFIKANAEEWIDLLRYNSMLSSPNTWINNFFSNLQGVAGVKPIEKTVTGAVDAVRSAITGKEREYLAGEGPAYLKGVVTNIGKATRNFTDAITGKSLNANPDTKHISLTTKGSKGRIAERSLDWTGRILEGTDQFFQTLATAGEDTADAYKASRGVKTKGTALDKAKKTVFRSELGDNNGSHVLDALDTVANVVQRLKGSKNIIVRTIAKYTLPFVKTPTNILKAGVEYSPLGFTTTFGSKTKTEQVAKAIMGTAVGVSTALLVGEDRLSWAEPTDAKKKDQFRAAGIQPYSIKIRDKWVSYSKLHPAIAFNFALVASLRDAEESKKLDDTQIETVLTGLSKWVKFYADQSYVKNIGEFVKTAQGDLEGPSRVLANYTQQLVPYRALMGWITRLTDPYQRKVDPKGNILEKQIQQMMTQIPGLSQKVPARVGINGEPVKSTNRAINAFSPARITTENPKQKQYYTALTDTAKVTTQKKQIGEAIDSGRIDSINLDPKRKTYFTAEYIRSEVEKIPKSDRAGRQKRLAELAPSITPEIAAEIKRIGVQDKQGLAKTDREMFLYDAPSRAIKIKERFAELTDRKKKAVLLHYYQQLGILTPEVAEELKKLKGAQ